MFSKQNDQQIFQNSILNIFVNSIEFNVADFYLLRFLILLDFCTKYSIKNIDITLTVITAKF